MKVDYFIVFGKIKVIGAKTGVDADIFGVQHLRKGQIHAVLATETTKGIVARCYHGRGNGTDGCCMIG